MFSNKWPARVLTLAILLLCIGGAWISGELVKQHANLWASQHATSGLFARICQVTERAGFSCSGTMESEWAAIRVSVPSISADFGIGMRTVEIPVAFLGLAYFVFLAVWYAFIGRPGQCGRRWHKMPLAVGLVGTGASVFFLAIMVLGLAPTCIWCYTLHAINLLLVIAIWILFRKSQPSQNILSEGSASPEQLAGMTLTFRKATSVIAFALIIIAGLWVHRREKLIMGNQLRNMIGYRNLIVSLQNDPDFLLREYYAQPQFEIPLRRDEFIPADHARLVVFTDFECSALRCGFGAYKKKALAAFSGRLSLSIRHFPLCMDCNESIEKTLHPNACQAAYAIEAARLQGGDEAVWRMHDLLFKNRKNLSHPVFAKLAAEAGLDTDLFEEDMRGETVREIVASDIALADELGVVGTPAMFLDGRRLTDLCNGPVFWQAIASVREDDVANLDYAAAVSFNESVAPQELASPWSATHEDN